MSKFISRMLVFATALIGATGSIILIFSYLLSRPSVYRLDSSIEIVVLGDSHTQCGIDDAKLTNAINVSNSADSYLYSYLKLEKVLEYNKQVKFVLLAYSGHNLSMAMEDWNFRDKNMRNKTSQYLPLMGTDELRLFLYKNPKALLSGIIQFPKMKLNVMRRLSSTSKITDIGVGGVEKLTREIRNWKGPFDTLKHESDGKVSPSQHIYLDKILSLCKKNNITLILIGTPLHSSYPRNYEPLAKQYYIKNMNNILWWNFTEMNLSDSCYADFEHLNVRGARYFSEQLQARINAEL